MKGKASGGVAASLGPGPSPSPSPIPSPSPSRRGAHTLRGSSEGGPNWNWMLIAGGALLSTLSIRLGYKLKQAIDTKHHDSTTNGLKGRSVSLSVSHISQLVYSFKIPSYS